jgi:hypothetical protein
MARWKLEQDRQDYLGAIRARWDLYASLTGKLVKELLEEAEGWAMEDEAGFGLVARVSLGRILDVVPDDAGKCIYESIH